MRSSHAFGSVHTSRSAWPAEIAPSSDLDTVSRRKTLCGSSCTIGLVPPASTQQNSQENDYGLLPIGAEVVSLAKHWLIMDSQREASARLSRALQWCSGRTNWWNLPCDNACGRGEQPAARKRTRDLFAVRFAAASGWMELLRIPASSSFDSCIESSNVLGNITLCRKGATASDNCPATVLAVCNQCQSSLFNDGRPRLPKFALANKLYLGKLPSAFDSLTWVEEQVCAIHRSTIHVYRLYYSDDPHNPYRSRGNVCAHPQNGCIYS